MEEKSGLEMEQRISFIKETKGWGGGNSRIVVALVSPFDESIKTIEPIWSRERRKNNGNEFKGNLLLNISEKK